MRDLRARCKNKLQWNLKCLVQTNVCCFFCVVSFCLISLENVVFLYYFLLLFYLSLSVSRLRFHKCELALKFKIFLYKVLKKYSSALFDFQQVQCHYLSCEDIKENTCSTEICLFNFLSYFCIFINTSKETIHYRVFKNSFESFQKDIPR